MGSEHFRTTTIVAFAAFFAIFISVSPAGAAGTCDLADDVAGQAAQTFKKDMAEGIKLFIKAKQLCADDPMHDYNLGVAYYLYGRLGEAETHLNAAVQRKGDSAVWLNNLAEVQLSLGKSREAADTAQKAVRLYDGLAAAHETLARAKAASGDLEGALKDIEQARAKFKSENKIQAAYDGILEDYLSHCLSLIQNGNVEAGLSGLKKADSDPKAARAYLLALSGTGKKAEALKEAATAAGRFPGNNEIAGVFDSVMEKTVRDFYLDYKQGRGTEAVKEAKMLAEAYPSNAAAKKAYDELFQAFINEASSISVPEPVQKGAAMAVGAARSEELLATIAGTGGPEENVTIDLEVDIEKQIPQGALENPYSVAVVIGNQRYARQNRGIGDVQYAERDAAVMKKYLTKVLGYDEKNIIHKNNLTSGDFRNIFGSAETRRGELHNYIHPKKTKEVFIYYSGHGIPAPDGTTAYLVPVDAQADLIANNGYNLELFYEVVENLKAAKVTVVLDACFSGDSMAGPLLKNISPAMVKTSDPAKEVANAAVFCGADKDQVCTWYPEKRHSTFTYFFLKGLGGAADINKDNTITVGEMKSYLAGEVPYWARRNSNRAQTPRITGDEAGILAKLK